MKNAQSLFLKIDYFSKSIGLPFPLFYALCDNLSDKLVSKIKFEDRSTLAQSRFSKFAKFVEWDARKVELFHNISRFHECI